jgi:hypothetical protein
MIQKAPFVLICFLIVVVLMACGSPRDDRDSLATEVAAEIYATQTAQVSAITGTPTNAPTDVPTNTAITTPAAPEIPSVAPSRTPTKAPASTPTAVTADTPAATSAVVLTPSPKPTEPPTARFTNTPAAASVPSVDASTLILAAVDFPSGFEEFSAADFGFPDDLNLGAGFRAESFFALFETEHFEIVFGFTTLLPNRSEQDRFDFELRQSDRMMETMVGAMGPDAVFDQAVLPDLNNIGNASMGATVGAVIEGFSWRIDVVAFRREIVGAVVAVVYLDGDVPVVPTNTVISKFDDRLVEALRSDE